MEEVAAASVEETNINEKKSPGSVGCATFLPRMFLRVLLVEGDDSTRHIIAALLRKCSYKVAAVADGLKAWETLKEKSHNIDLILTEVDLPSISGFGLLTMIMEHEICKTTPVIMMSKHDSMSTVFKCMLKGAADFLVKPIRKNELRNLWQHVWRRTSSNGVRQAAQDGNLAHQTLDATSENNATSNHSSAYIAHLQKNKECIEKGSVAQSSCTKPDMEAESANVHNMQEEPLHLNCFCNSLVINTNEKKCEEKARLGDTSLIGGNGNGGMMGGDGNGGKSMKQSPQETPHNQAIDSAESSLQEKIAYPRIMSGDEVVSSSYKYDSYIMHETDDHSNLLVEPSEKAIDLIGAIDNQTQCRYQHNNHTVVEGYVSKGAENIFDAKDGMRKSSTMPLLDLSLRRTQSDGCQNQEIEVKYGLNHSNASAFSWYSNKTLQPPFQSSTSFTEPQKVTSISHKTLSDEGHANANDREWIAMPHDSNREVPCFRFVSLDPERIVFPHSQGGFFPVPVPMQGVSLDGLSAGHPLVQHVFSSQSGFPLWSTNSTSQLEAIHVSSSNRSNPEAHPSKQNHHTCDQSGDKPVFHDEHKQQSEESKEDPGYISSTTGRSGSTILCNAITSQFNSSGCGSACKGSNGDATAAALPRVAVESRNNEGILAHDRAGMLDFQRSSRREVALTKFRLKRKDRCYEKKVRYHSRKGLAEQRPRVKGQFVRQVQCDPHPPSMETDHCCGDSSAV